MASSRPPPNSYAHPQHHPQHHPHQSVSHHPHPHHHQSNPSTYLPNGGGPMNIPPPPMPQQPQPFQPAGPHPGAAGLPPNSRLIEKSGARILCIADVRGSLRSLNELAKQANADHIIHTGDFGFYDDTSLDRIADKTLKHVAQYSPLLSEQQKKIIQTPNPPGVTIKQRVQQALPNGEQLLLSELPHFLSKRYTLDVPVYTVWGACEDVRVLEKFRSGEYKVDKLHIIDEANSRLLDVGGVKLRLLGLGGAVVMHKLFDNGDGKTTIAGGLGTMWTTVLQMGELVDTANRVYDPMETRVFITHASPARDGLLNQLSVTLKADFSISAGLHFRYGSSYNEFSVNSTLDSYRGKLASAKASFNDVWETVKGEVLPTIAQNTVQNTFLENTLAFVDKMPSNPNGGNPFGGPANNTPAQGYVDESAFKNMWNFNLADAAYGWLILEIESGRIGTEMKAEGFNFSHRTGKQSTTATAQQQQQQQQQQQAAATTPTATSPAVNVNSASQATTLAAIPPAVPTYPQPNSMRKPPQTTQNQNQNQSQPSPQLLPNEPVKPALPPAAAVNAPLPAPTPSEDPSIPPQQTETKPASPTISPTSPSSRPQDGGSRRSEIHEKYKRGLFVINVPNDEVRAIFPSEDQAKIKEVAEKFARESGKKYWYVYFETPEIMKDVLHRLPQEHKTPGAGKLMVKEIEDQSYSGGFNQRNGTGTTGRAGMHDSKWSRGGPDSSSFSRSGGGPNAGPGRGQGAGENTSESEGTGYRSRGFSGRGGGDKSRGASGTGGGYDRGGRGRGGRGRGRGGMRGEDGVESTNA